MPRLHDDDRREAPAERQPSLPAASAAPASRVLAMQSTFGNAAVGRMLARYGTGEHAQMGGARTTKIQGVELEEGEIVALGDFYETAAEMMSADPAELSQLVVLIRRDRDAKLGRPGANHVSTAEWQAATSKRKGKNYLALAEDNASHFAPAKAGAAAGGRNHKAEWEKYHQQALEKALAAASGDGKVPPEAIALNGFAAHFLTDAFAAGHLFNKQEMLERAKAEWKKLATTGWAFEENKLTKAVAKQVLADPVAGPKLKAKQLKLIDWGPVTEQRFSEFLWQMADSDKSRDKFFNAFVLMVHNRLNASVRDEPGFAIHVENARGDAWDLSGDDTLANSPRTLEIALQAVDESYANLKLAARTTGVLDHVACFKRVWDYTPKPTKIGAEHMEALIKSALDYDDTDVQDAFAEITINNVGVAIAELEKKGYLRDVPAEVPKEERRLPLGSKI